MPPHIHMRQFFVEEFLVIGGRLLRMVTTQSSKFEKIQFAAPAPKNLDYYRQLFAVDVEFECRENRVYMSSPAIDSPVQGHDRELNEACSSQCQHILHQLATGSDVELSLKSLLVNSAGPLLDFAGAAQQLGLSQRTLSRHLHDGKIGYRKLKNDFRRDLALQYLASGRLSVKEISYLLGYASPSAFCRAFKQWTGQAPGHYLNK